MVELYTPAQAYKLAVEHFQAERYAEAEHIFRQLVAVSNDHEFLSYFFGMTCCQVGKVDEGAIWLRKTLDINWEHAGAHLNLAVALHKLSEPANAMASLRNAARINPDSLCGSNRVK
jgi:predicted Zn-dependent protease